VLSNYCFSHLILLRSFSICLKAFMMSNTSWMKTILLRIGNALVLDDSDMSQKAYQEYLKCVVLLADHLKQFSFSNEDLEISSCEAFSLLRQCIDRSEAMVMNYFRKFPDKNVNNQQKQSSVRLSPSPSPSPSPTITTTTTIITAQQQNKQFVDSALEGGTLSPESSSLNNSKSDLSQEEEILIGQPLMKAQMRNRKLYQNYSKKMMRLYNANLAAPLLQKQISELNLAYVREHSENLCIARKEQEKLLAEINEKKLKQKRTISLSENAKSCSDKKSSSFFLGNLSSASFSPNLLSNIQFKKSNVSSSDGKKLVNTEQYELLRNELSKNLDDENAISLILSNAFGNNQHYLGKALIDFVLTWKQNSFSCDDPNTFSRLINEIQIFEESTVELLLKLFRSEAIEQKRESDLQGFLFGVIEKNVFPHVYGNLFELYKQKYREKDIALMQRFEVFKSLSLAHLGVDQKYWLYSSSSMLQSADNSCTTLDPYQEAIESMKSVRTEITPFSKLKCLLNVSQYICGSIESFYKNQDIQVTIGADELLPLFNYVIIKSAVPFLYSELSLIADFIDDQNSIGQLGYILVSFQTCLQYISHFDFDEMQQNQKETYYSLSFSTPQSVLPASSEETSYQSPINTTDDDIDRKTNRDLKSLRK